MQHAQSSTPVSPALVDVLLPVFTFFLARSWSRSTDIRSAYRCLAVCSSWAAVVRLPTLWASVRVSSYADEGPDSIGRYVAFNTHSLAKLKPLVSDSSRLEFFFARWSDELLSTVLSVALSAGSCLRVLSLQSIRRLQLPLAMSALGDGCRHLEEFVLERSRCDTMEELPLLEGLFCQWRALQKLSLRFVPIAEATIALIPKVTDLSLTADAWHCSPEAVRAIASCRDLRRFNFTAAPRVAAFVWVFGSALEEVLRRCALEALSLGRLVLDQQVFDQMGRSIARHLSVVRLDNCRWHSIPRRTLESFGMLEELEMNNCVAVRDEELFGLCDATQRSLRRLSLRNVHGTDVSDEGLLAVARAFPAMQDLRITGDGDGCVAVTDRLLEELASNPRALLTHLRQLNLRGCLALSPSAVHRLRTERPLLRCHWSELRTV